MLVNQSVIIFNILVVIILVALVAVFIILWQKKIQLLKDCQTALANHIIIPNTSNCPSCPIVNCPILPFDTTGDTTLRFFYILSKGPITKNAAPVGTILFQGYINIDTVSSPAVVIGVYERCSLVNLILPKNEIENPTADNVYPISPYGFNFESTALFNALNYSTNTPAITSHFNLMFNQTYNLYHDGAQISIVKYTIMFG